MTTRKMVFGTYDTAVNGLWTLTGWELAPATPLTNLIDVPGRMDGPLDLSTALTDGEPRFSSRNLTATFESSEGTRIEREARISAMVNALSGWRMNIVVPDHPGYYLTGNSLNVERVYNDEAHASVRVTAVCNPWLYASEETNVELEASQTEQTVTLLNNGRKTVVPAISVAGSEVVLVYGQRSWTLEPGTYKLPDLVLPQGSALLTYSGTGTAVLTYREAVLQ